MRLTDGKRSAVSDEFGALCAHTHAALDGVPRGPLAGMSFVAKDVFDVEGHRTGAGSPDWLRTHPPARKTAPVIRRLVEAGASMVGRAHTDELAYSLIGQNAHYGMPVNPRARERIPGGSSSGAAAAVAGRLVEFSIGTDCGGSVRLPASCCGILGFRPTHGRIPLNHAVPLAPSFDTVGWFARDPGVLEAVGRALLEDRGRTAVPKRLYVASDLFALVPDAIAAKLQAGIDVVAATVGKVEKRLVLDALDVDRVQVFRILQGAEVWATHGEWIRRTQPRLGPGVRDRFAMAAAVTADEVSKANTQRERFTAHIEGVLQDGTLICLPTAPGIAPLRDATPAELETFRGEALGLLSVAGLARIPQVSLPLTSFDGCPIGLSLIAARGADTMLLVLAEKVMRQSQRDGDRGVAGY